jgi:hypothetical protein
MRGGVTADVLMYETDLEDLEVIGKIVEENIEASKKTGLNLI